MTDVDGPHAPAADAAADVRGDGRIFVSYASQDAAVADRLCAVLEAAGQACWIAPRDVRAGDSYAAAIVEAINSSRLLLLVLSKGAIESPHVLREVERASSKRRPILSIRMDATPLPPDLEYFLSANQWLDASAVALERIVPELLESVRPRAAGGSARPAGTGPSRARVAEPSAWRGRATTAAIVVLGLGLAIVLADRFWPSRRAPAAPTAPAVPAEASAPRAAPAAADADTASPDKSIAVLPFADMSEKQDQEFFSDGLSEELIGLLAKLPDLRVSARTSSFYFKGKSETTAAIGRALKVTHLLEGSVRKSGNRLRISAQLVRADNGYQVWSETYNRDLTDIFKVQDDIAAAVVQSLKAALLTAKPRAAVSSSDAEAYTAVLRARYLLVRGGDQDSRDAIAALKGAIARDPNYALAWAALALAHRRRSSFIDETPDESMALARAEAEKALALDPNCEEAHVALADVKLFYDFDPAGAAHELRAVLAIDPTRFPGERNPVYDGCIMGPCYQSSLEWLTQDIARDPLNPSAYGARALAEYVHGDLSAAERDARRAVEIGPELGYFHFMLVRILFARGDLPHLLDAATVRADSNYSRAAKALALHAVARHAEADRALDELLTRDAGGSAYQIAEVYAVRGDLEASMIWLERAHRQHDSGLWMLQVDPLLKPLARDARFLALRRKLGMLT